MDMTFTYTATLQYNLTQGLRQAKRLHLTVGEQSISLLPLTRFHCQISLVPPLQSGSPPASQPTMTSGHCCYGNKKCDTKPF